MKVIIGILFTPLVYVIMAPVCAMWVFQEEIKKKGSKKVVEDHYFFIIFMGFITTLALWGIYLAL